MQISLPYGTIQNKILSKNKIMAYRF